MFRDSHHSRSHPLKQTSPILTSCPVGSNHTAKHLTFLEMSMQWGRLHLSLLDTFFWHVQNTHLQTSHTRDLNAFYNAIFILFAPSMDSGWVLFSASKWCQQLCGTADRLGTKFSGNCFLKEFTSPILPPGNLTASVHSIVDSLLERNSSGNQSFSSAVFHSPQLNEECGIFDPVVEKWDRARCDSFRGAVCQFTKGNIRANI